MDCPRLFKNRVSGRILGRQDGVLYRLRIGSSRVVRISRRNVFDERKRKIVIV